MTKKLKEVVDQYTADQFEQKIFPYCLLTGFIVCVIFVVLCIMNPWMLVLVPIIGMVGVIAFFLILVVALGLSKFVRFLIELITGEEF